METTQNKPTPALIAEWLAYVQNRLAENTHKGYISAIKPFRLYAPLDIKELSPAHIERCLMVLKAKGLSAKTINCCLMAVKSFCRYLSDYYGLDNPAAKVKQLPENHTPQRFLTEQEYDAVLTVCKPDEKIPIQLLGCMGLRASELLSIEPSNISPDKKFLRLNGKGGKYRAIPLNPICQKYLNEDFTFQLLTHSTYLQLNRLCHRLAKRANIESFTPHALRRFFATRMIAGGCDIYRLSKTLGHSSIELTQKLYIQFQESQVAGLTDILDR